MPKLIHLVELGMLEWHYTPPILWAALMGFMALVVPVPFLPTVKATVLSGLFLFCIGILYGSSVTASSV